MNNLPNLPQLEFEIGAAVVKESGDYVFRGRVVAAFHKLHGAPRYAVENSDGILMIMAPHQLKRPDDAKPRDPPRRFTGSLRGHR